MSTKKETIPKLKGNLSSLCHFFLWTLILMKNIGKLSLFFPCPALYERFFSEFVFLIMPNFKTEIYININWSMQPLDPSHPLKGTLGPGHKPGWSLFCPEVTRAQPPALPRNSNGRLGFPGPTQEEARNPLRNSRIPPQLEKNHVFPTSSQDEALAAMASQEKNHVPSWSAKRYCGGFMIVKLWAFLT